MRYEMIGVAWIQVESAARWVAFQQAVSSAAAVLQAVSTAVQL
jgi:hypothetical protein